MLKFYQFPGPWDVSSASPFSTKLEAFMLWQNISYQVITVMSLKGAPKGKIPYIEDENGKLGDSNLIIEYLTKKHNLNPDAGMSPEQKAQARAFRYLCEESLYWAMVYFRWIDNKGWDVMKDAFFSNMSPLIQPIAFPMIRKYVRKMLHAQGMGRHTAEDIARIACDDLKALSDFLRDKRYFFNDAISMTDIVVYSVVANFVSGPFDNPVANYARNIPNLMEHTERIRKQCFPDDSASKVKQVA